MPSKSAACGPTAEPRRKTDRDRLRRGLYRSAWRNSGSLAYMESLTMKLRNDICSAAGPRHCLQLSPLYERPSTRVPRPSDHRARRGHLRLRRPRQRVHRGVVPVCISEDVKGGLPQGVQIIGRRFDENRCFDAAEVIESRCGTFTPIEPRSEGGAHSTFPPNPLIQTNSGSVALLPQPHC